MSTFKHGLLLGTILFAVSLSVPAALYKWVDADGVTQYTQTPPPSGRFQELHSAPPPASRSIPEQPSEETSPEEQTAPATSADTPPQDDQRQAEQQAAREQNCRLARQRLSQLENHARIRYAAEDGSIHVMGEDEKQAKLAETRAMIAESCH